MLALASLVSCSVEEESYAWMMNLCIASKVFSDPSSGLGVPNVSSRKVSVMSENFLQTFQNVAFPLPRKPETVSQPVKQWKIGRA